MACTLNKLDGVPGDYIMTSLCRTVAGVLRASDLDREMI